MEKPFLWKSELAEMLEISPRQLAKLMNEDFFEELQSSGYKNKKIKRLYPKVVRAFFECYGRPLTIKDLTE